MARRPRNRSDTRERGMTLIEILVVLVLHRRRDRRRRRQLSSAAARRPRPTPPRSRSARSARRSISTSSRSAAIRRRRRACRRSSRRPPASPTGTARTGRRARCRRTRGATSTSTRRPANAPYEIISLGADGKEGGDGPNKDISASWRCASSAPAVGTPGTCHGRARGLTLLELLIVLALMAIIAAFVVPMFGGRGVDHRAARLRRARSPRDCASRAARRCDSAARPRRARPRAGRTFQGRATTRASTRCRTSIELKLFTAQSDLVNDNVGAIRFYPDGGSQRRTHHASPRASASTTSTSTG